MSELDEGHFAECPNCQEKLDPEALTYGRDVKCPNCWAILKTEWEENGDHISMFIVGIKSFALPD